jgi:CRP-like cAMP-binding protein
MSQLLRQHIEKITPLTDSEFEYILPFFSSRKIRKHQFLVQEGNPVLYDFFVLHGCLKAYHIDENGKEHILQFATEEWWVTDYQAYFNQTPATIHVDCIEPCELLMLSLYNREKLCSELHKMEHFFRMKLTARSIALQQRILGMMNSTAQQRYEQLLQLYPELLKRVSKQLIASYLGVSRETLSRLHSTNK